MDLRRLRFLLELSRRGSMRAVADELGVTVSTVSQQIAILARDVGAALVEQHGRRVRLTPAGRRLADHAVTILAAVEAAGLDLQPEAEPSGLVRVAGFASAIRQVLLPIAGDLVHSHPQLRLRIHEHEPAEALHLLAGDHVDLALTYDYNLAPASFGPEVEVTPMWSTSWSLGVPAADALSSTVGQPSSSGQPGANAPAVFGRFRDRCWIVNSRNTADEHVIAAICAMAGFAPDIAHHADSLELVHDLILARLGIGLLPADQPVPAQIALLPLTGPDVSMRCYAVVPRGRAAWPPLALILGLLSRMVAASAAMAPPATTATIGVAG